MVALKTQFERAHNALIPESTLVLIGTALDGPSRIPFRINQNLDIHGILGDSPLSRALESASRSGSADIILYRLNGEHATCNVTHTIVNAETGLEQKETILSLRSVSANNDVNDILISVDGYTFTATDTQGITRTYSLGVYKTAAELAYAINRDAHYGLLEFEVISYEDHFPMNAFMGEYQFMSVFQGGSSGIELIPNRSGEQDIQPVLTNLKASLLSALFSDDVLDQEAHEINTELGLVDFGLICLVDMFHDDEGMDFAKILGNFCLSKTERLGQGCLGVIGTKPILDKTTELIENQITTLVRLSQEERMGQSVADSNPYLDKDVDYRSHIQIVVGDSLIATPFGYHMQSLAYAYAGLQAFTPIQNSLTNKKITGFDRLSHEFSKEHVDSLSANGYISIVSSIRKGFVTYKSFTYLAKDTSYYNRPNVVRITHYVSRYLVESLRDIVGQNVTRLTKTVIEQRALDVTSRLLTPEIVKSYSVKVEIASRSEVNVRLEILPYSEVSKISSIVKIPYPRGVVIL